MRMKGRIIDLIHDGGRGLVVGSGIRGGRERRRWVAAAIWPTRFPILGDGSTYVLGVRTSL